jgi:ferric-dicitrate binding protein FerR (iron transport regulator)
MDLTDMPIKLFLKKLTLEADPGEEQRFNDRIVSDTRKMEEFRRIEKIWQESGKLGLFEKIDTESDWELVRSRIRIPLTQKYRQIPVYSYALRVAAVIIIASGLSVGIYKTISFVNREKPAGFVSATASGNTRTLNLPDGSVITLKGGSSLTYRSDFGKITRDVILNGEAVFDVVPDKEHPFKVYTGESVVTVTGTSFSVREEKGLVKVSVLSGNVILSNTGENAKQITIAANQSGYLLPGHDLKIENKIEENDLSWKTGHLVFRETPIDNALIDIARHFRKELVVETDIKEDITAEFQDQPLSEILDEIILVAGLKIDTTGTALIVRK